MKKELEMKIGSKTLKCVLFFVAWAAIWSVSPAQDFEKVQIETVNVADGIYMLRGAGGNIGVCAGEDGILMVDTQFAEIMDKIESAIAEIGSGPVRLVINTNWHYDHTYGNEPLGRSGALVVAHENSRTRMMSAQHFSDLGADIPVFPDAALPDLTFTDALTLHLNGEEIQVVHIENAHSDADLVIYFRKANVIHTGDVFFSVLYPYIDIEHGGSIDGMIAASDKLLGMIDDKTRIIPGHGPLSDREGLSAFRHRLITIRDRVKSQIEAGKTLEEIIASKPTADFDKESAQSLPPEMFVRIVYNDLSRK